MIAGVMVQARYTERQREAGQPDLSANVCCHYQLIKREKIPDEQIVTMMYDDIAENHKNPQKGNILSVLDNENVYEGFLKDYTGKDVTPKNFLNALQGKCADKKVIKSGKDDNIFIYMTGLGTESTFEFPEESANVCCHYQLIKRQGIPDEQIVTMMYDDIAENHDGRDDNIYIYMTGLGTESTFEFPEQSDVKKHYLSEFLKK
ncbi:Legumain [Triplophysa tibetana]|uniref:Legumain n=1 Tax=Triplophysa tibetana TaxID=1572043 RepID=A0A5A9N646_9TELE|nr:Legumain [Triplophysa tibetana]